MYIHQNLVHPSNSQFESMFRFDILERHPTAFSRQLGEAVIMKNSIAVILNSKDEYNRCIVPDISLKDRGWNEGVFQRQYAKFEGKVRPRTKGINDKNYYLKQIMTTEDEGF